MSRNAIDSPRDAQPFTTGKTAPLFSDRVAIRAIPLIDRALSESTTLHLPAHTAHPEITPAAADPLIHPGQARAEARAFAARAKSF